MMGKYLFLAAMLLLAVSLLAQTSRDVYNENGVLLGYSAEKYNSIALSGGVWDQYEVKFTFSNKSGHYIHNPQSCL
jgi:hypothetical protein